MPIDIKIAEDPELKPQITVFGVGGAGGNAVDNMIAQELDGVEFVAANSDSQALQGSRANRVIQLGAGVTSGLGAGAKPEIGRQAAEESHKEVEEVLTGSHMCFITAGMGGGTGTGAAPVIAKAARDMGILTVGVVTKPFEFEGARRMKIAEEGITQLQQAVDTLIIIPNQNLFRVANERTTFAEAFIMADDVLYQGVKGVTDLMVNPGLINLDFADVRAVMNEMGKAMMGTGEAEGDCRALEAAEKAIANPLLDEVSLKGARGVMVNITGGPDLTLFEVDEATNRIRKEADPDASIYFGSAFDPAMEGVVRVSVVATGIESEGNRAFDTDRSSTYKTYSAPTSSYEAPKASEYEAAEYEEEPVAEAPREVAADEQPSTQAMREGPYTLDSASFAAQHQQEAQPTVSAAPQAVDSIPTQAVETASVTDIKSTRGFGATRNFEGEDFGRSRAFGGNDLAQKMMGGSERQEPEQRSRREDLGASIPGFLRRQAN